MKHRSNFFFEKSKLKHFLVLLGLYIAGVLLVLFLRPSYMLNLFIVYFPGMLYVFFLIKKSRKKILLFGLVSILFIIPVELLARVTDSWDVLSTLPRLFGLAPIENMFYALVNIMYPLAFYEYFYDGDRNREISKNWKILVALFLLLFAVVLAVFHIDPNMLLLDYWFIGLAILVPIFVLLLVFKRYILKRLLVVALVFGLMFGIHEIVSMYLGHWWWPGTYVLPLEIGGHIYPVEDFVIWLLFSNAAVISGYEVLWD